jgi:hypothetical protein
MVHIESDNNGIMTTTFTQNEEMKNSKENNSIAKKSSRRDE